MNILGPLAVVACLALIAFGLVYLVMDRIARRAARMLRGPKPSVREGDDPLG